jgi:hypothetical protein
LSSQKTPAHHHRSRNQLRGSVCQKPTRPTRPEATLLCYASPPAASTPEVPAPGRSSPTRRDHQPEARHPHPGP